MVAAMTQDAPKRGRGRPPKYDVKVDWISSGLSPLETMLEIMRHPDSPLKTRLEAARHAAPYLHRRAEAKPDADEAPVQTTAEAEWASDLGHRLN